eukprot:TRINITY_DN243_c0_g2_i1.p1 TRINITY_DN243_c0_g2~~TRINITY_DN243_c0_g2_i1.p1  ORF type:complete len:444 (-),score=148.38 TRINITY_DN243_c0_g2_i1:416-1747(-)
MKLLLAILALLAVILAVPVNFMAPLDIMNYQGVLSNPSHTFWQLKQIKYMGAHGLMVDVWWGIGEPSPKQYNFGGYVQLAKMCKSLDLKLQAVMSFHAAGTNVGDTYKVPLPQFVRDVGKNNPDIWYTDIQKHRDDEYIALWADNERIFAGRTPLEMYGDYMDAFMNAMGDLMGSTVEELQVGLGPCGEARYPGYQLNHWHFCGVGEFQSYNSYAVNDLKAEANAIGHPEWGKFGGPQNAGNYNSTPAYTGFYREGGFDNYASEYGHFFLKWYSDSLLKHIDRVMGKAVEVNKNRASLAAKVAGIHWWYKSPNHAAELTAGYYNTNGNNAYDDIAKVLKKHGAVFDFTCMEMYDNGQQGGCGAGPEELVSQVKQASDNNGIRMSGENAMPKNDDWHFKQMVRQSSGLKAFTYLRINDYNVGNLFNNFKNWINNMRNLGDEAEN